MGSFRRCVFLYDLLKDHMPKTIENKIMEISIMGCARNSSPHNGNKVKIKGSSAQCMAQAVDAVIPSLSRFIALIIFISDY